MNIVSLPATFLRLQYRVVRLPLQLIEDRVMTRLDAEAPARLLYERSFGTLDAAVGSVLGDVRLQASGAALADRSDTLSRAARMEAAADAKREKADYAMESKRNELDAELKDARNARREEVEEARESAQRRTSRAARSAQRTTAAVKEGVDRAANRRASAVEEVRKGEQDAIRSRENAVVTAAESKVDDAAAKRAAAAAKREKAARVGEMASAEKARRQER